jgi:hypothetical protein
MRTGRAVLEQLRFDRVRHASAFCSEGWGLRVALPRITALCATGNGLVCRGQRAAQSCRCTRPSVNAVNDCYTPTSGPLRHL